MLLHKSLAKAAARFVSDDASRPALQGVHFPKAGVLYASDGHRAIVAEFTAPEPDSFPALPGAPPLETPDKPVTIRPDALLDAAGATAKRGYLPVLQYVALHRIPDAGDNGHHLRAEIRATDLEKAHRVTVHAIDSPYPDVPKVVPNGEPKATITMNARLLMSALQAAIDTAGPGRQPVEVQIEVRDQHTAALVRWEVVDIGLKATALVMPMRSRKA